MDLALNWIVPAASPLGEQLSSLLPEDWKALDLAVFARYRMELKWSREDEANLDILGSVLTKEPHYKLVLTLAPDAFIGDLEELILGI